VNQREDWSIDERTWLWDADNSLLVYGEEMKTQEDGHSKEDDPARMD